MTQSWCLSLLLPDRRPFPCRNLNLNLHSLIQKTRNNHGRGRSRVIQPLPQHWPTFFEIVTRWKDILDSDDLVYGGTCFRQGRLDVSEYLLRLFFDVGGYHACLVVISISVSPNPFQEPK